jgi:hypothetical protein
LKHHHGSPFIAIQTPEPPAVATDLGGIPFLLLFGHRSSLRYCEGADLTKVVMLSRKKGISG